jgi:phosphate transport system permease protein
VSRAIGETAPLIVIGAWGFMQFIPVHPFDGFSAMPIQIYLWTVMPQAEFRHVAAAGIIVLLVVLLGLNALAIFMRDRAEQQLRS